MRLNFTNLSSIAAAVLVIGICVVAIVFGIQALPEYTMTRHGWVALGLGTGLSVLVGGGLAAVLIIGRRRGFDEEAHEIYKSVDPSAQAGEASAEPR